MKKLRIAFLWHQHQPYYRVENDFLLPWVLFHGTKDYFDIPEILYEFPSIKQTFNFAPSLCLQIDEYINKTAIDRIQRLTSIESSKLNDEQKKDILDSFFKCNYYNMIANNERYLELYNLAINNNNDINVFKEQDYLDLQCLYNLAWFGYFSSNRSIIKRLINKKRDFTENEKQMIISEQFEILSQINQQYMKLKSLGQIELSCSPMFHPILPLVIDSNSARQTLGNIELPNPLYQYPEDARMQIREGLNYFENVFNYKPIGMWPSEGSISNEAIDLFVAEGIKWVATDEAVLFNSINSNNSLDKYFPYKFKSNNGEAILFFRDHTLSDKIGFTYSTWNPKDAAHDFVNYLKNIRNSLISTYGDNILDQAIVPIILDGENCWEYYHENGIPFLRELFSLISNDMELNTITFDECINSTTNFKTIDNIQAGSWINGNFSIWIGDSEDIAAWNQLSKARMIFEKKKSELSDEQIANALDAIMIAEGSDWFWWYGPEHPTKDKPIFDYIFRYYIRKIYEFCNEKVPNELNSPIYESNIIFSSVINNNPISIDDIIRQCKSNGILLKSNNDNTSMHQISDKVKSCYAIDLNFRIGILIEFSESIEKLGTIEINSDNRMLVKLSNKAQKFDFDIEHSGIAIYSNVTQIYIEVPNLMFKIGENALSVRTSFSKNSYI